VLAHNIESRYRGLMSAGDSAFITRNPHATLTANPTGVPKIPIRLTLALRLVLEIDPNLLKLGHSSTFPRLDSFSRNALSSIASEPLLLHLSPMLSITCL
jgi:hypothetical protein